MQAAALMIIIITIAGARLLIPLLFLMNACNYYTRTWVLHGA